VRIAFVPIVLITGLLCTSLAPLRLRAVSWLSGAAPCSDFPEPYRQVDIENCKTSIYLGSVSIKLSPLAHSDGSFRATYRASVVPFFFYSEHGALEVRFDAEQLAQLRQGDRVHFTGSARAEDSGERPITGHVTPESEATGKIKVRVHVSEKIQLIFNTHYRFPALQAPPASRVGR
jgi:hypothetical protein